MYWVTKGACYSSAITALSHAASSPDFNGCIKRKSPLGAGWLLGAPHGEHSAFRASLHPSEVPKPCSKSDEASPPWRFFKTRDFPGQSRILFSHCTRREKINCSSAAQEELIPRSERDRCLEHLYPALAKMSIKTTRRSSQRGCSDPNHIKITLDFLS